MRGVNRKNSDVLLMCTQWNSTVSLSVKQTTAASVTCIPVRARARTYFMSCWMCLGVICDATLSSRITEWSTSRSRRPTHTGTDPDRQKTST